METITSYPATPTTQISHMRHSSTSWPKTSSNPAMQAPETSQYLQPLSAPASQESFISARSNGSSVQPYLQSSSSNVSQLTNDTDPISPVVPASKQQYEQRNGTAPGATRRTITPEGQVQYGGRDAEHVLASPMSVVSPVTNGAKRTASGHVKNAPSLPSTPLAATFADRMSRRESISSTGSRAGELAATLKTRLGYAMAKVQHGWEHKTIAEVEQLATQKMSPNRHSMSHLDYSHRPVSAGLSNGTARLSMYESYGPPMLDGTTSPPSKRRSGNYSGFLASPQQPRPAWNNAPHLAPPADIRPSTSSTQHLYYSTPSSQSTVQNLQNAMSPPRTPVNGHSSRRPATIRTDTQQAEAEREALETLLQLGSPHTSQASRQLHNASQASSNQASPLRTEFPTPRRVTFARSESGSSARGSSAGDAGGEA